MLNQSEIIIDTMVSFDLYPATILGTSIKLAKVLGVCNAQVAMAAGHDGPAMHAIVFPTLPSGTPNGYDRYHYVHLKLQNGTKTFIGIPWIKESTFTVEVVRTLAFFIENITPDQQSHAIAALSAIGLTVAKTEIVNSNDPP